MTDRAKATPTVAYILARFPYLSETFIHEEIVGLQETGIPIHIFAFRGADSVLAETSRSHVRSDPFYLPDSPVTRFVSIVLANLQAVIARPIRYLRAFLATMPDFRELRTFAGSVYFVNRMETIGVGRIHVHFAFELAGAARSLSLLLSIPYSVTVHGEHLFRTPAGTLWRRLKDADLVIAVSEFHKRYLLAKCPQLEADKVPVVFSGIPAPPSIPARNEHARKLIVSVGRLFEAKGHRILIDALGILDERHIPFTCKIVGVGPLRNNLEQQISALGLQSSAILLGALRHADVQELLVEADLFVLACVKDSRGGMDGMPVALMEAMAMALPVVSSRLSGIPELVVPGTGLLVTSGSSLELADALQALLMDDNLREKLGRAARERVMSHFTISHHTRSMRSLYVDSVN
jgi:glycosyltransferase involved in cell wall biosynthesis